MTKPVRVISYIIFIIFFLGILPSRAFAFDLIQSIPQFLHQSFTVVNQDATAEINIPPAFIPESVTGHIPSITFGDLLNASSSSYLQAEDTSTPSSLPPTPAYSSQMDKIRQILAQLDQSFNENTQDSSQHQETETTVPTPLPTPFIPLPTLIAGVQDIITNQNQQNPPADKMLQPTPYPQIQNTGVANKTYITIAVLGDSMVDTLGKDLPALTGLLKDAYPQHTFKLLNYGQGSTDLDSGLYRLTNSTTYLGTAYPGLLTYQPDILVVESFAYNHWSGNSWDLDRQWLTIAKIIDIVKEKSPETKIMLAATIAPNGNTFGDGKLNWMPSLKWQSAAIIKEYLQNITNFASSEHYPLADAYHPSLGPDGQGLSRYINAGDHLHPSGEGGFLFSQKIVEAIKANQLIK